jgi:hypothetical protein
VTCGFFAVRRSLFVARLDGCERAVAHNRSSRLQPPSSLSTAACCTVACSRCLFEGGPCSPLIFCARCINFMCCLQSTIQHPRAPGVGERCGGLHRVSVSSCPQRHQPTVEAGSSGQLDGRVFCFCDVKLIESHLTVLFLLMLHTALWSQLCRAGDSAAGLC